MPIMEPEPWLSPRRQQLASYSHAYAVALQMRRQSGIRQYILRTANPLQPFRITSQAPELDERILAMVA